MNLTRMKTWTTTVLTPLARQDMCIRATWAYNEHSAFRIFIFWLRWPPTLETTRSGPILAGHE